MKLYGSIRLCLNIKTLRQRLLSDNDSTCSLHFCLFFSIWAPQTLKVSHFVYLNSSTPNLELAFLNRYEFIGVIFGKNVFNISRKLDDTKEWNILRWMKYQTRFHIEGFTLSYNYYPVSLSTINIKKKHIQRLYFYPKPTELALSTAARTYLPWNGSVKVL